MSAGLITAPADADTEAGTVSVEAGAAKTTIAAVVRVLAAPKTGSGQSLETRRAGAERDRLATVTRAGKALTREFVITAHDVERSLSEDEYLALTTKLANDADMEVIRPLKWLIGLVNNALRTAKTPKTAPAQPGLSVDEVETKRLRLLKQHKRINAKTEFLDRDDVTFVELGVARLQLLNKPVTAATRGEVAWLIRRLNKAFSTKAEAKAPRLAETSYSS